MAEATTTAPVQLGSSRDATAFGRLRGFLITLARQKPLGFVSLIIIFIMVVVAIIPDPIAPHEPNNTRAGNARFQKYCFGPKDTFLCPTVPGIQGASQFTSTPPVEGKLSNPLGTDNLNRDVFSRLVFATRWVTFVSAIAVTVSATLALAIGLISGYFGGKTDAIVQRFVDAIMALPTLVVLIFLATLFGTDNPIRGFTQLAVILGVLGGVGGSRVIRSAVISVRSAQYLEAARVIGANNQRVILRHVLPNIFGALMVQATIGLGAVILAESALSFLGFGVADPNNPTWGQMLQLGQQVANQHPFQAVWPGLAITIAVFSYNMLGDALRDLLDPRLRGARGGYG